MERFADKAFSTYSVYTVARSGGICVKCPCCQGLGLVTVDTETGSFSFRCTGCGTRKVKDAKTYRYSVENQCLRCGRYYRVSVPEEKQSFPVLHVSCPHCGHTMAGEVKRARQGTLVLTEVKNGREPYFGYELWFLAPFGNKLVWALNREHLCYLIDYLGAGLREKPGGGAMRTQADQLPTSMKTAKNRERIVRLLVDMRKK